nr:MAG TPA: tail protein [Caudoviricetes sp.]
MFKSVTMISANRESLTLPIRDAYKTGYNVVDITGITPTDADIKLSAINSIDGSFYNGYHKNHRTIVMTFKYMYPNDLDAGIEKLRHDMYRLCQIGSKITLVFETGKRGFEGYRKCKIEGFVKSNEGHIFDEHEGCSVAVECPNPWFENADNTIVTEFKSLIIKPLFEFQALKYGDREGWFPSLRNVPYNTKESVSAADKNSYVDNSEFADVYRSDVISFKYDGEGAPGVNITINLSPVILDTAFIKIINKNTNQYMSLDTGVIKRLMGSDLNKGYIEISTVQGNKYINCIVGNKVMSVIPALYKTSTWFTLSAGKNEFYIPVAKDSNYLDFSISYKALYDGV